MKAKLILIPVWIIISGSASLADTLVKIYEFKHPVIERTGNYSVFSFEGARLLGEPGKATLPFYPVELLLPPGQVTTDISIQFENLLVIQGQFILLPSQRVRPISEDKEEKWLIDDDFYRSSITYPSSGKLKVETQFMNGFGIALAVFTPMRYTPSKQEVSYFQRVIVTIHTAPDPNIADHKLNFFPSGEIKGELARIIQNPEAIKQYFSGRDSITVDYDYLVITANQYLADFDTLIHFYRPRGIRTQVFTTEFISATVDGDDLQEKIRNFIIGEYQQHGIGYVLIGGDVEVVPYRGFYCHVISGGGYTDYGIPADLYYSALDGNWDNDGDGIWGEPDEDDLFPEVAVGRMTFSSTVELNKMLHKTIMYQSNPVEGELTRPILAGELLWNNPITWGSDYLKLLVGYRTDNGYTTRCIPTAHPRDTLYDRYSHWTKNDLINHVNSGRPWLHHVGHSNYTYVMKMDISDITNSNFSQANGINHNYTVVYTHGCMCGGFDQADCIAEKMVGIDNFAVAFIGNSRYGWFNEGTTDGPSQHLHREFMDAVYRDSLYRIGMAHLKSKSETAPFVDIESEYEPGATRWCFYDNNILGDPMMALWTDEPQQLEADYPEFIPIGNDSIGVQLSGSGGVFHNYTCSIYRNDTLYGKAETDSSGAAVILLPDGITQGPISLIVSGYNILPHYFDIQVCNFWLGLTTDWSDADNWFTGVIPDTSSSVIIPADPQGGEFPVLNGSDTRHCKSICIEPGAQFVIGKGGTFSVGDD